MTELESALAAIDPASLDYQGWTAVGMALKEAGQPASVWEDWSRRDAARYHPGECARKWESFHGSETPVTASSIFALARQRGWRPPEQALDCHPVIFWPVFFRAFRYCHLADFSPGVRPQRHCIIIPCRDKVRLVNHVNVTVRIYLLQRIERSTEGSRLLLYKGGFIAIVSIDHHSIGSCRVKPGQYIHITFIVDLGDFCRAKHSVLGFGKNV